MSNPLLVQNFVAETIIPNNRIVRVNHGATARKVALATGSMDLIVGVLNEMPGGVRVGERVDVVRAGVAFVEAGDEVVAGAPLTTDAQGRAIEAAPDNGENVRVIGFADEAATAAGDVIQFLIAPGYYQGS